MIIDRGIQHQLLSHVFLGLSAQSVASTTNESTLLSTPTHPHNWTTFVNKLKTAHSNKSIQVGGFIENQGKSQNINININGLIGDHFSINNHNDSNGLVGVGYYLDGQRTNRFNLSYGINAFYLGQGSFNKHSNQLINTLRTGNSYANALLCTLTI